jgi:hypothetical protein
MKAYLTFIQIASVYVNILIYINIYIYILICTNINEKHLRAVDGGTRLVSHMYTY